MKVLIELGLALNLQQAPLRPLYHSKGTQYRHQYECSFITVNFCFVFNIQRGKKRLQCLDGIGSSYLGAHK